MVTLPDDFTGFLAAGRQLEYAHEDCECGRITLLPIGKHELSEIEIDGQTVRDTTPDPNEGVDGYYSVPAINLVESCEDYDPQHILSWLPESNLYMSWDCDHWVAMAFPNVNWSDISANPLPYINAQWESPSIGKPFVPWPDYPFKNGRPF